MNDDAGMLREFCEFIPHVISKAKIYPIVKLISKEIYNTLVKSKVLPPTSQKHFLALFQAESLPWKNIYTLARSVALDSYSRIFQYKCLNNILYLNLPLFRMGISESSLCSYCQEHDETIQHLFYNCNISNTLWSELTNFFIGKFILPSLDLQSAV